MTNKFKITFCLLLSFHCCFLFAQKKDSLNHITLKEVIIADSAINTSHSRASHTTIDNIIIEKSASLSVGEAAKMIPSVAVKDYGGLGGMKTISVRGLGSSHSGIIYDGVSVGECSSAGVDLGKFSSSNVKEIDLYNAQSYSLLQTARNLSMANVLMIQTQKPSFKEGKSAFLSLKTTYGSFNYFDFDLSTAKRINSKWISQLSAFVSSTNGKYPYTLHYGPYSTDSTSKEKRENSDYWGGRIEWNNFLSFNSRTDLKLKAYYFYSERGLPNNTSLYYLKSQQRLWDKDFFVQSIFSHSFSERLQYRNHSKLSYSYTRYLDPNISNIQGKEDDIYHKREYYTSNVVSYTLVKNCSIALSNDLFLNSMSNNATFYRSPKRENSLTALVFLYDNKRLLINANLLHTFVSDRNEKDSKTIFQRHLSPFLSVGYSFPCGISISAFYKNVFRVPTFNELYFNRVAAASLSAEQAQQFNLHSSYSLSFNSQQESNINFSCDFYHNRVKDKIVAVPRNNLFIWSIINYGLVQINGLDLQFQYNMAFSHETKIMCRLSYSLQQALNKTDKTLETFNCQIPYVPLHSGNVFLDFENPIINIALSTQIVGERYSLPENIERYRLKPYIDQTITLSKDLTLCKQKFSLSASCLNLFGVQYEVVQSYPMPQRQFRISLKTTF